MRATVIVACSLAVAATFVRDASACGGCFHGEPAGPTVADAASQQMPTVVTDHRMVLAMTEQGTTLWDQIEYSGDPAEFAWVLPIQGAAVVSVGSDAFVDALDQITAPHILGPKVYCNAPPAPPPSYGGGGSDYGSNASAPSSSSDFGCGCGSSDDVATSGPAGAYAADTGTSGYDDAGIDLQDTDPPDEGVVISHREAVGPYETVQIHGDGTESIIGWLRRNGYDVPKDIEPMVQKYVDEKFDFLAVRLHPGADVHAMKPIRVSWKGKIPTLPLRMVAAGVASSVGLKLFVIGDGRWRTKNFDTFTIDESELTWDFSLSRSTYTMVRDARAKEKDGRAWSLESSIDVRGDTLPVKDDDPPPDAALEADAEAEAEAATDGASDSDATSDGASDGPADVSTDAGDLPPISTMANDVEVAFFGGDIKRVTRLRADLPVRHLDVDLELEADDVQALRPVEYRVSNAVHADILCPYGVAYLSTASVRDVPQPAANADTQAGACAVGDRHRPLRLSMLGLGLLAIMGVGRRVMRRR